MKQSLFLLIQLPLCLQGEPIKLRPGAASLLAETNLVLIMVSNTHRSPDTDRIMNAKSDNETPLFAEVFTPTGSSDEKENTRRDVYTINAQEDITELTQKYPEAFIRWSYMGNDDNNAE